MTTNAIQMTSVVYMVKPMNLASLKFSGTFRVLNAYKVHMRMRKKSNPSGAFSLVCFVVVGVVVGVVVSRARRFVCVSFKIRSGEVR